MFLSPSFAKRRRKELAARERLSAAPKNGELQKEFARQLASAEAAANAKAQLAELLKRRKTATESEWGAVINAYDEVDRTTLISCIDRLCSMIGDTGGGCG